MFMIASKPVVTEVSTHPLEVVEEHLDVLIVSSALHFKLAVATDNDNKGGSYEDTEFSYTPRLDNNRDRDLLELLPDYLREEIMFSRMNAAMFYGRVVDTLTKKRVEE